MKELKKTLQIVSKFENQETDGEHRILFVASSPKYDRANEAVDTESLRLPLRNGGHAIAGKIAADGIDGLDIPLMLNHSADVTDIIGSVRRAYFKDGELIFEAGISEREKAQEILQLMQEDHLGNAFSITMADYDYNFDAGIIKNAEIIEVSVVYRGCNKEARLLSVKSFEETEMDQPADKADEIVETKPVEQVEESEEETTTEAPAEPVTKDAVPEDVEAETVAETVTEEPEATEAPAEEATETEEETAEEVNQVKEPEMTKEIAADGVQAVAVQEKKISTNYLASKQAVIDFRNHIKASKGMSSDEVLKSWKESVIAKGITGDAFLPESIESIFFKAWEDKTEIISTFRQLNTKRAAVYAETASSNGNAKGHVKGEAKVNQELKQYRRDLIALCIYKKLAIDLQDIFDDESGEILRFRIEELAARIAHAIAVGAIFGDSTDVYFDDGRGLYSMVDDIEANANTFGSTVATKVTAAATDNAFDMAVKVLAKVKASRKVLITGEDFIANIRTAKNDNDTYLFPFGVSVEDLIGARIFEMEELDDSDYEAIAYADQSYVLVGERTPAVRTQFDLTYNKDVMLMERFVGGSAQGYKTVAGIVAAA